MPRILLTGATGFVGSALYPALSDFEGDAEVVCASRNPERAERRHPERAWVHLDVDAPSTMEPALAGVETVYYLIHSMGSDGAPDDYEATEARSAQAFAAAADRAGVRRIIYLGGVAPAGPPSKHLRSRLRTGEILRGGAVPAIELRAGMIIGTGSQSWQIVRDLSMRLPVMILPRWLQFRSQPVAIADVLAALIHARGLPEADAGCYSLPGPETMTTEEILYRVAHLRGIRPLTVRVPMLSVKLSSYWLQWVTRADYGIARELVQGLTSDLVASERPYWDKMPAHALTPLDAAAQQAFDEEQGTLPISTVAVEWTMHRMSRRAPKAG